MQLYEVQRCQRRTTNNNQIRAHSDSRSPSSGSGSEAGSSPKFFSSRLETVTLRRSHSSLPSEKLRNGIFSYYLENPIKMLSPLEWLSILALSRTPEKEQKPASWGCFERPWWHCTHLWVLCPSVNLHAAAWDFNLHWCKDNPGWPSCLAHPGANEVQKHMGCCHPPC